MSRSVEAETSRLCLFWTCLCNVWPRAFSARSVMTLYALTPLHRPRRLGFRLGPPHVCMLQCCAHWSTGRRGMLLVIVKLSLEESYYCWLFWLTLCIVTIPPGVSFHCPTIRQASNSDILSLLMSEFYFHIHVKLALLHVYGRLWMHHSLFICGSRSLIVLFWLVGLNSCIVSFPLWSKFNLTFGISIIKLMQL